MSFLSSPRISSEASTSSRRGGAHKRMVLRVEGGGVREIFPTRSKARILIINDVEQDLFTFNNDFNGVREHRFTINVNTYFSKIFRAIFFQH